VDVLKIQLHPGTENSLAVIFLQLIEKGSFKSNPKSAESNPNRNLKALLANHTLYSGLGTAG
jgi:hypothetical protein